MSRIGKRIIKIPSTVSVVFSNDEKNNEVLCKVKGPLGELQRSFKKDIKISVSDTNEISLEPVLQSKFTDALWGTYGSHLANMIKGVSEGFEKKLQIEGVGFKAALVGDKIVLNLGFSHQVEMKIPEGIKVLVEKNIVTITGTDKDVVGQFSSTIVAKKKPEPYKGKGIRYQGQVIKIKQGKKSVT